MSVEQLTDEMRTQLLSGAQRRVRYERRRRRFTSGIAALAVLAGVVAAIVFSRDPSMIETIGSTSTSTSIASTTVPVATAPVRPGGAPEFAVCDSFLTIGESKRSLSSVEKSDWETLARDAAGTADATLATIVAAARDTWTENVNAEHIAATNQLTDHCRAIGSPSYNPRFVPIESGPSPAVDLTRFGEEQRIEFTGEPRPVWQRPVGRAISAVQSGTSRAGAYVMYWSYLGTFDRPSYCLAYGRTGNANVVGNGGHSGCGSDDPRDALYVSNLEGVGCCLSSLHTASTTSFVVMESGGERYVQRPAARTAVIVWATPPADRSVTAREYDANGNELRCHGTC